MEVNTIEVLLIQYQNTTDATMYLQINIQVIFKNISLNLKEDLCMFTSHAMLTLLLNDVKMGKAVSSGFQVVTIKKT